MTRLESAPDTRWLAANELHAHARCPQTAYWQSMCGQHRSCGPHTPLQPAGASPDTVSKSVSKFRICKFSIQNDEQCYKAQVASSETQVTANPGVYDNKSWCLPSALSLHESDNEPHTLTVASDYKICACLSRCSHPCCTNSFPHPPTNTARAH